MHANAQWKQAFVLIVHQGHRLLGTSCNGAASTHRHAMTITISKVTPLAGCHCIAESAKAG